jgi:hypothetical protein
VIRVICMPEVCHRPRNRRFGADWSAVRLNITE